MQCIKDGLLDFVLIISSVRRGPDDDLNLGIDNLTQTLSDNLSIAVKQTADDPDTDEHWINAAKLAELCANTARDGMTCSFRQFLSRPTHLPCRAHSRPAVEGWCHPVYY